MRIFSNLKEARDEIERDLHEMGLKYQTMTVQDKVVGGDPGFMTLELQGYGYKIVAAEDIDDFIEARHLNAKWIDAEIAERTSGESLNPGAAWRLRPEIWGEFLHEGQFSYTYPERMAHVNQVENCLEELRFRPNSRQCVIAIWKPADNRQIGGAVRVPCSIFYQLMIRNRAVDLHYVQRSCDLMTHFNYDLVLAIRFQQWAARRLNLPTGIFHHYIVSLHAFKKDLPPGIF